MRLVAFLLITIFLSTTSPNAAELLFGGDVTLARNIHPGQNRFFSKKARERIGQADLFIWNAEFSGQSDTLKKKKFVFSCDSDIVRHFRFPNGIATVANNHSFDGETTGFANLLKSMMKHGMAYTGLRNFDPEKNFLSATVDGRRYYILNFSPMIARTPMPYATPEYRDIKASLRFLQGQRQPGDKVVVCIHDGMEGTTDFSERQKTMASELSALGADIIAFSHSHTYIDPYREGNALVIRGLGNFIFGGNMKWKNNNDVRILSVDPDSLEWRWLNGRTRNYIFDM